MDKKEARDILIGRLVQLDERYWAAAPAGTKFHFHGIRDGAGDVYLFGVTHLTHCYQAAEMEPAIALAAAETALYSLGRPIKPKSAPAEKACLYAPTWIAPVLLSICQSNEELQMTAYTGQSLLMGKLRCRIALWILERHLPAGFTRLGKSPSPSKPIVEKKPKEKTPKTKIPKEKSATPKAATNAVAPKRKKAAPKRLKKKTPPKRLKK